LSKWIGPQLDPNGAGGDYVFRTTFNLAGYDPATARVQGDWATDNVGTDLRINGASTGLQNNTQFTAYTHFVITNGFITGTNVLEFAVNNAGAEANPIGLRVENLRAGAKPMVSAAPKIAILRGAQGATLSWPASAAGFKLFATPSLNAPSWTEVSGVQTGSATHSITIGLTNTARYYRLQQ
jgi:hypothetical protein